MKIGSIFNFRSSSVFTLAHEIKSRFLGCSISFLTKCQLKLCSASGFFAGKNYASWANEDAPSRDWSLARGRIARKQAITRNLFCGQGISIFLEPLGPLSSSCHSSFGVFFLRNFAFSSRRTR
jgi:hypothetical protein